MSKLLQLLAQREYRAHEQATDGREGSARRAEAASKDVQEHKIRELLKANRQGKADD